MLALLGGACASNSESNEQPDAGVQPVSCTMQVAQTGDGASFCAVTVTLSVRCDGDQGVGSATITAQTDPSLDTGVMSSVLSVGCGQTQRVTYGGMPCAEAADATAKLDDGTECSGVGVGIY